MAALSVASVVLALGLLLVFAYGSVRRLLSVLFFGSLGGNNPFKKLACPDPAMSELVIDGKKRDSVLRQVFSEEKIPSELDAIVIGSGIGGLSVAAILAKAGKKVLVLEQHSKAGGSSQTFVDKGFEFDIGIHYVGLLHEDTTSRFLADQLSEYRLKWIKKEEFYETFIVASPDGAGDQDCTPAHSMKRFPIPCGQEQWMQSLIRHFPREEEAIKRYFAIIKSFKEIGIIFRLLKFLPCWCSHVFAALFKTRVGSSVLQRIFPNIEGSMKSHADVLNELMDDKELKAVLANTFAEHGMLPKETPFGLQAPLNRNCNGSYYPRGGSSEIAFSIIPTIEKAGGRVLVQAKVVNVIMDDSMNQVIGVQVKTSHSTCKIMAPVVISDAGVHNTFEHLLSRNVVKKFRLEKLLDSVNYSPSAITVFIGLRGSKEELGLANTCNIKLAYPNTYNGILDKYFSLPPSDASMSTAPYVFATFPSTIDPTYNDRYPGKSACALFVPSRYEWFVEWKGHTEEEEYHALKMAFGRQAWNQFCELHPQLKDKVEYFNVWSPLDYHYYLGSPNGQLYGLSNDIQRFSLEVFPQLRPDIGISGMYMTGQDLVTSGFIGAMLGGLMCSSVILKRNLWDDLLKLKGK